MKIWTGTLSDVTKKISSTKNSTHSELDLFNNENTLILVFQSSFKSKNLKQTSVFETHFPLAITIGCTTAGSILQTRVLDAEIAVAMIRFESTKIKKYTSPIKNSRESHKIGSEIISNLNTPTLKGLLVLSEGLNINGSELIDGISENLSKPIPIFGGLSADGARFQTTYVLSENLWESDKLIALGFYGEQINILTSSRGGWDVLGPERLVTKAENNVLYQLDSKPALEIYKKYLGDKASDLPASALLFPLQIWNRKNPERIVRTILSVNENDGSMTFAGNIPVGSQSQLMYANFTRIVTAAGLAASDLKDKIPIDRPVLNLMVSCVGRRLILKERIEEELEMVSSFSPANTTQIGFYSYGEFSPSSTSLKCELHNQTMTTAYIYET
jgi:hypothetical protein